MPFYHNINPAIISLGPLEIRWYGLFYVIGFAIAYFMLPWLAKKRGFKFSKDDAMDYLTYLALGVIIGGRLGYVLFYNLPYYITSRLDILAVWKGGMSFHGGAIGTAIAAYLYCRKKKIHFYDLADLTIFPLAIALAIGRMGNFVNGEVIGKVTNWTWCIDYSKNQFISYPPDGCRYPTQIFEAGKNLVIFGVVWSLRKKHLPRGFYLYSFLALYGTMRFFIEFLKEPDPAYYILGLTVGQLLCIPMIAIGLVMLFRLKR